jgi:hypothetical protein
VPRHDDRTGGGSAERRLAGEHLVAHGGEGVLVGPPVHRVLMRRLLRRHVGRRPEHVAGAGERLVVARAGGLERAGNPEVRDQHHPVVGQQDVLGLDVAVDHPLAVGVGEGLRRLAGDTQRLLDGKRPLAT